MVTSTDDLTAESIPGTDSGATPSYTAAVAALRAEVLKNPAQPGKLQVMAWEQALV